MTGPQKFRFLRCVERDIVMIVTEETCNSKSSSGVFFVSRTEFKLPCPLKTDNPVIRDMDWEDTARK